MIKDFTNGKKFNEFINLFAVTADKGRGFKNKVLYGFHWSSGGGTYLQWLLKYFYDFEFDYIVDDNEISYGIKIFRRNLFDYLNPEETIVFAATEEGIGFLSQEGYHIDVNLFYMNDILEIQPVGFYEWLEKKYSLDLIGRETGKDINEMCKDALTYSISRGMSFPMVCEYMAINFKDAAILDIGCGKGGAMILMKDFGFRHVDGLELSHDLCLIAEHNMEKVGCDCRIIETDATTYDDIDQYSLYYIYDSFRGDTFRKVIDNLEKSVRRCKRDVHIVYANPWEHKKVIEHGIFRLKEQLDGDWFTRMTNIYDVQQFH